MTCRFAAMLAMAISLAAPVLAQPAPCIERGDLLAQIKERHLDKPGAIAMTAHGATVEAVRAEDGHWSLILRHPSGRTCQLAAGDAPISLPASLAGQTF